MVLISLIASASAIAFVILIGVIVGCICYWKVCRKKAPKKELTDIELDNERKPQMSRDTVILIDNSKRTRSDIKQKYNLLNEDV